MFTILFLFLCLTNPAFSGMDEDIYYLKERGIIQDSITKEEVAPALKKIMERVEKSRDATDIKVINRLIADLSAETTKQAVALSALSKKMDIVESTSQTNKLQFAVLDKEINRFKLGLSGSFRQEGVIYKRYEGGGETLIYPPSLNFKDTLVDLELRGSLFAGADCRIGLGIKGKDISLEKFNLTLSSARFKLMGFQDSKQSLPQSSDFLTIYSPQKFAPAKGILVSGNFSYKDNYFGEIKMFGGPKGDSDLYLVSFDSHLPLIKGDNNFTIDVKVNYVEKGKGTRTAEFLTDRKYDSILSLEGELSFDNKIVQNTSILISYAKYLSTEISDGSIDYEEMATLPLFRIENRDALAVYLNLSPSFSKDIKLTYGLFESNSIFTTDDFSIREWDQAGNKESIKRRLVFKESDIIEYGPNVGGSFIAFIGGEGRVFSQSISVHYAKDKTKQTEMTKSAIDTKVNNGRFKWNNGLALYDFRDPLFKMEGHSLITTAIDIELRYLFIKSLYKTEDKDGAVGGSFDGMTVFNDKDHLSFGASLLTKQLFSSSNDLSELSISVLYNNLTAIKGFSFLRDGDGFEVGVSFDKKGLLASFPGAEHEVQMHAAGYFYNFLTERLSFEPRIALGVQDDNTYLGLGIKSNYKMWNDLSISCNIGNMEDNIDNNYFIDREYKLNTKFRSKRAKFSVESSYFFDLRFDFGI